MTDNNRQQLTTTDNNRQQLFIRNLYQILHCEFCKICICINSNVRQIFQFPGAIYIKILLENRAPEDFENRVKNSRNCQEN